MEKQLLLLLMAVGVCTSNHAISWDYFWIVDGNDTRLPKSWSEAQESCASFSSEMLTLDLVTEDRLNSIADGVNVLWMGLRRNQTNDSAWNWINSRMVETTTGDISQTLTWSDSEGHSSHCVYLNSDLTWSSKRCDEKQNFFCSSENGIQHVTNELSWQKARSHCQDAQGDLGVNIPQASSHGTQEGWIGVYREGGDRWVDISGQSVGEGSWAPGEPLTNDCGAYDGDKKKWKSYPCSSILDFVCYEDSLLVVPERKSWEEAMEHCRSLKEECTDGTCLVSHELLTVERAEDYSYVRKRIYGATTDEVWTGLRFLGGHWWWVNREPLNDGGSLPQCPPQGHNCGVISKTNDTTWLTADCAKKLSFVCYKQTLPDSTTML